MSAKIYHNPRCKKSRAGLEHLKSVTNDFELVDYIKNGISIEEIKEILLKLNVKPHALIRTQEDLYKKELKKLNMTDEEWIQVIHENPKLLKRPIIISGYNAVIGDPPGNIDKVFKS